MKGNKVAAVNYLLTKAKSKGKKVPSDKLHSNQGQVKRKKGRSSYTAQQPRPSQRQKVAACAVILHCNQGQVKRQNGSSSYTAQAKSKGKKVAADKLLSNQGKSKGKKVAADILLSNQGQVKRQKDSSSSTAQQTAG